MKKFALVILFLSVCVFNLNAQTDTIRVVTYNVLNWPEDAQNVRTPHFRMILEELDADLLITQEMHSESGANDFLNDILDSDVYSRSRSRIMFTNDVVLFYKHDMFDIVRETGVRTVLRDITVFELEYLMEDIDAPNLFLAGAHLKAGNDESDESSRRTEARAFVREVRDEWLDEHLILGGDLNVYGSGEPAFRELTDDSLFYDPVDMLGTWHEGRRYITQLTQSTRTRVVGSGSTGGLDDRFDFLLMSDEFNQEGGWQYVQDSYYPFGNDGNEDRLNMAINWSRNTAVSADMADALHDASDHLPVVAEIMVTDEASVSGDDAMLPEKVQLCAYPNPFNSTVNLQFNLPVSGMTWLTVFNMQGAVIEVLREGRLPSGSHSFTFNAGENPAGVYFAELKTGDIYLMQKILLIR